MFKWLSKKVPCPASDEQVELPAVRLWYVTWTSRYGPFHHEVEKQMEAFPVKEDAEKFAEALRDAFKLIRHKSAIKVVVEERA